MSEKDRILHETDNLIIDLIDKVAELERLKKPENYSYLITNIRYYVAQEIKE